MKTANSISTNRSNKFGFVEIPDPIASAIDGGVSFAGFRAAARYRKLNYTFATEANRPIFLSARVSSTSGRSTAISIGENASVRVSVFSGGEDPIETSTALF
jgi:hypothetical protein